MTEAEVWERFDKLKTWTPKSYLIEDNFLNFSSKSFDRLCSEFSKSQSSTFYNSVLPILEILENKFVTNNDLNTLPEYKKLLNKYKIKDLINFHLIHNKEIKLVDLIEELKSEYRKYNRKKKNLKIHVKFNVTNEIIGFVNFYSITNYSRRTYNIVYGFETNIRNYYLDLINDCPSDNQFFQEEVGKIFSLFSKSLWADSTLLEKNKNILLSYFKNLPNHFSLLNQISSEDYLKPEILNEIRSFYGRTNSHNHHFDSLVNINLNKNNFDSAVKFAQLALNNSGDTLPGSIWTRYFENIVKKYSKILLKFNTDSNKRLLMKTN